MLVLNLSTQPVGLLQSQTMFYTGLVFMLVLHKSFLLTPLKDFACVWLVDVFTNSSTHTHLRCVFASACLAATGSLAFNTCMPVSPQRLSAASTRRHFVQQAENGVDSS